MTLSELIMQRVELDDELTATLVCTEDEKYRVSILKKQKDGIQSVKGWEFEKSPITEAVATSWFDYIQRTMRQHTVMPRRLTDIPEVLEVTSNDAEEIVYKLLMSGTELSGK